MTAIEPALTQPAPQSADTLSGRSFALSGPSQQSDPATTPVRGDLAHVRMAGKVFVPHYAVPMPHTVMAATAVFARNDINADPVGALSPGGVFNVLDIAGDWAWGVIDAEGEDGPVGYVALSVLEAQA